MTIMEYESRFHELARQANFILTSEYERVFFFYGIETSSLHIYTKFGCYG